MYCKEPDCVRTRADLREAWERILKLDQELREMGETINRLVNHPDAPQAPRV